MRHRVLGAFSAVVLTAALGLASGPAPAAVPQPDVVSRNPDDNIPQLVSTTQVAVPHVDAFGQVGSTGIAAGLFDSASDSSGTVHTELTNVFAFNTNTGVINAAFRPTISGGQIWAVETDPTTNSVWLGGDFKTVNGVAYAGLVKLNATTGAVDPTFKPFWKSGKVRKVQLVTLAGAPHLIVAGGMTKKLVSVNPTSGKNDGYLNLAIADPIPGAWGGLMVHQFAIDPTGTHLAATGNFLTVDGQARSRFFMLDLTNTGTIPFGTAGASLSSWYYPGFAKPCTTSAARRIANLQGLDWSPDGRFFTVAATGQIPTYKSEVWHAWMTDAAKAQTTVCDGVGRFALADPTQPVWINYTGGDSVWVVQDTGVAVYVQGHFKWFANPDGWASIGVGDKTSGLQPARRAGIAALDPASGLALSWNPAVPGTAGGKALLATTSGLWVGSDAPSFANEVHRGFAYVPLP